MTWQQGDKGINTHIIYLVLPEYSAPVLEESTFDWIRIA